MAAGLATLRLLRDQQVIDSLESPSARLVDSVAKAASTAGVPLQANRVGSMMTFFFADAPVIDYASARLSDADRYGRFFRSLLERGVYLPPSQFESLFVSAAHDESAIDAIVAAAEAAFAAMASGESNPL
jgi:glutamate-1-semialdehyde 2,1-aminomutase